MVIFKKLTLLLFGFFTVNNAQTLRQRMIGGNVAEKEDPFPYVVSIQHLNYGVDKPFCTGSIIAERFVVTAAHCIVMMEGPFRPAQYFQVVAGIRDLNSTSSDDRVVVGVVEMFVPAEFDIQSQNNNAGDIAVLKLSKDLGLMKNPNIGKINLPVKHNESYAGVEATVIGFGWNKITLAYQYPEIPGLESLDGRSDGKMRYAKAKVFDNAECVKSYSESYQKPITRKNICAQVKQRDPAIIEGVCKADSGGPLVYNNVLIGVVNTSPLTCREDVQPGVYARVSEFTGFIKKVLSGNIDMTIRSSRSNF